ncbi:MAG: class II aldolase/adducin family protein, partial [Actinobacteria bacterium]|nr:class II aldolase/adducin family protein [Actinomycetota bacterium]
MSTREDVLSTAKELFSRRLVDGTEGNVSARLDDGTICITPSSLNYEVMTVEDLVVMDGDGEVVEGTRGPSSEKAVHLACYKAFAEVGAVIHSHPVNASIFAVARQPIPAAIEESVVFIGGDIPICDFVTTGTDELGDEAVRVLADRSAALLANHGLVAIGADPYSALRVTALVEKVAQIVLGARVLGGESAVPQQVKDN